MDLKDMTAEQLDQYEREADMADDGYAVLEAQQERYRRLNPPKAKPYPDSLQHAVGVFAAADLAGIGLVPAKDVRQAERDFRREGYCPDAWRRTRQLLAIQRTGKRTK